MVPASGHRRTLVAVVAVLLLGGAGVWWSRSGSPASAPVPAPAVPVAVARVIRADVPHSTSSIGTVQALEHVVIRTQVDGILTSLRFADGDQVQRGELLATLDSRAAAAALQSAEARQLAEQAQLESARVDLRRYESAVGGGAVSRQTLEQQAAQVRELEAGVAAARAEVAAARVTLDHTRIVAPIAGRTGLRRVDVGNLVRVSDAEGLFTVSQVDPIAVLFALPQDYLPRVRALVGRPTAVVTAFDRVGGQVLGQGVLVTMDNNVDAATGTVRLKAEFPNPDGALWPGQFVTVRLTTGLSPAALTVPAAAVLRGRDQDYVFRVRGGVAEVAPVTIEHETDVLAVVASGLAEGDEVIVDGQSRVRGGSAVTSGAAPGGVTTAPKK